MTRLALILCVLVLCVAAVPPLPKRVVESPKGREQRLAMVKVPSLVVPFIKEGKLEWDKPSQTNSTGFAIYSKILLSPGVTAWKLEGRLTNTYSFPITMTNAMCFYHVAAFWP